MRRRDEESPGGIGSERNLVCVRDGMRLDGQDLGRDSCFLLCKSAAIAAVVVVMVVVAFVTAVPFVTTVAFMTSVSIPGSVA